MRRGYHQDVTNSCGAGEIVSHASISFFARTPGREPCSRCRRLRTLWAALRRRRRQDLEYAAGSTGNGQARPCVPNAARPFAASQAQQRLQAFCVGKSRENPGFGGVRHAVTRHITTELRAENRTTLLTLLDPDQNLFQWFDVAAQGPESLRCDGLKKNESEFAELHIRGGSRRWPLARSRFYLIEESLCSV